MAKEVKINRTGIVVICALGVVVIFFLLYQARGGGYVEPTVRVSQLISASIQLVEDAGKIVVGIRKSSDDDIKPLLKGKTKEGKGEYVTLGDKLSHQIIVSGLKSLWPNLPFQSEETDVPDAETKAKISTTNEEVMRAANRDEEVPMDAVTVWIDPLDATQEYTEGEKDKSLLKYVTVMVCIAIKGKPIAGIIHQPYNENGKSEEGGGVTKWAWVDHGASLSLTKAVEPHSRQNDEKVRMVVSRSHPGDVVSVAESAFEGGVTSVEAAGAGYKVLQIVEGHADLYLHTTAIKKWDICAGDAILRAVGGHMTTRTGEEIDYSFKGSPKNELGIVAAVKDHAKYLDKLKIE